MELHTLSRHMLRSALLGATVLGGLPALAQSVSTGTPTPTVATPANPDQTTAADPGTEQTTPAPAGGDGDIVVTGFRQSYANAIAAKRSVVSISDGISSDGLGRFPDLNVGEALQRVPGVQINREAEGRNATINLRGLPGEYSRLTLNGVAFAEPILNEAAPLGAFNSDIFSGIVVDKSPLASAQSGGLSGNVDLQIAPALGRKDGGSAKVAYEYNELGKKKSPAATVSYNHHFTDDFAVFGVFAYKRENFRRDTLQFNSYLAATPAQAQANPTQLGAYYPTSAACPSCTGTTTTAGVIYNSQLRQYSRLNEGNLFSGAAGAEYRLSDEAKVGVTGFYSDRNLPKTRQYLLITSQAATSGIRALTTPVKLADGRYVLNDYDYTNADLVSSTRDYAQHQKAWGTNLNGEWKDDDWRFNAIGTVSKASNSSVEIGIDSEQLPTAAGNGINGTLHSGAGSLDDFSFTLNPQNPLNFNGVTNWGNTALPQAYLNGTTLANSTNRFNFQGSQAYARNDLYAGQIDVERKIDSFINAVQVGVRYEHNKFTSEGYRIMAFGLPISAANPINNSFLVQSPTSAGFFGGDIASTQNWQVINSDALIDRLRPVQTYPNSTLSPTGYNILYSDDNYQLNNFTNTNDLMIVYGQLKYEFELGGITIRGNGGLRYENTENTIEALNRVTLSNGGIGAPGDFRARTYKQDYSKWLPSFIAVADITDRLIVRGAAYKTYVRPQPRQFSASTVVGIPLNGVYTVRLGNSDLKPYDSTSFDVSAEWYNRANSLFSVAVFQKRIKGLIANITDPRQLCPADATALGLGTLRINGDRCESSLTFTQGGVTQPFVVAASGFVNQDRPVKVRGVEVNAQQSFDFLPGFLKNFGGGANYAYTTISGRTSTGAQATLPGVSKHNVNVIGYYETPLFGIRGVYNFRSSYDLASAGTFTGNARQVRSRGQFDMSATVNFTDFLSLSVDAYNLTNAVRYEYENQTNLPRRFDYDGRTYTATIRATF